jgi:hypothetical protein
MNKFVLNNPLDPKSLFMVDSKLKSKVTLKSQKPPNIDVYMLWWVNTAVLVRKNCIKTGTDFQIGTITKTEIDFLKNWIQNQILSSILMCEIRTITFLKT